MKIELKFDELMSAAVMEGRKCCTFRREPHGNVGDTFEVGGHTYRIVHIVDLRLHDAVTFYGAEGFASIDEMYDWAITHYGAEYDIGMEGYVHFFARVPEAGKLRRPKNSGGRKMRLLDVPFKPGEKVQTFYGTEECPNRVLIKQTGEYYCVSGHHNCDDPSKCYVALRNFQNHGRKEASQ